MGFSTTGVAIKLQYHGIGMKFSLQDYKKCINGVSLPPHITNTKGLKDNTYLRVPTMKSDPKVKLSVNEASCKAVKRFG